MGGGEEHAAVVARAFGGQRRLAQPLGEAGELRHREDIETTLLALGDHQALRELVAELGRQEQPALVVQTWRVGAEEHAPPPHVAPAASARWCLLSPTALHVTPLHSHVNQNADRWPSEIRF